MKIAVHMHLLAFNAVQRYGEDANVTVYVDADESLDFSDLFAGGNGYGRYAHIRDHLPRSFSVGDVLSLDFARRDPLTGTRYWHHRCELVGWYALTNTEYKQYRESVLAE